MLFRSIALFAGLSIIGCAAPAASPEEGDVGTSEAALSPWSLRHRTALERARVLGAAEGAVVVDYAPPAQDGYVAPYVAFEAVHFDASNDPAEVSVAGDFPSSATVVVTDEQFRVMAVARTVESVAGLEEARVRIPSGAGGRFVLVRDPKWVKPMAFEVRVGH